MTHTLQQRYEDKQRTKKLLHDRSKVILEARRERLILEKFDRNTLKSVVELIKRLKSIDFQGLTALEQARNAAVNDATKALAGMGTGSFINRVKQLFGKGDPLGDPLSFASSMNSMFTDMQELLQAIGAQEDQTVQDAIAGDQQDPEKQKMLSRVISGGIRPTKGSANWPQRYLKKGPKTVAQEISQMKVGDLFKVSKTVADATANAKATQQAAADAGKAASAGTSPTTGTSPTSSTSGTEETRGSRPSKETSGTGEVDKTSLSDADRRKVMAKVRDVYGAIASDFGDLDKSVVQQVLAVLAYNGRLS